MQGIEEFMKRGYQNHDEAHNYKHAKKVYSNAQDIVLREGIVMTSQEELEFPIVMLGHDLRDHKLASTGRCLPAAEIEAYYVSVLGPESTVKVIHIHDNCSWSKRNVSVPLATGDWMRLVLQDADWLEAIGEVGLARCIAYNTEYGPNGDVSSAVCQHINEKLLHIPQQLNFEASRRLAADHNLLGPLVEYLKVSNYA